MNLSVNKGEEYWNMNGGILGVGEHMGEWEWPKEEINAQGRPKMATNMH